MSFVELFRQVGVQQNQKGVELRTNIASLMPFSRDKREKSSKRRSIKENAKDLYLLDYSFLKSIRCGMVKTENEFS